MSAFNNDVSIFGATHRHKRTGGLYMRMDLPYKALGGTWREISEVLDVVVYRSLDGQVYATTAERWTEAFEPIPDRPSGEVLAEVRAHMGPVDWSAVEMPE